MLCLALFLAALAALIVWIFHLVKRVTDYDDKVERQPLNFPSLNETVSVPKEDVVQPTETPKKLYFNLNGEPKEVFSSDKHRSDALYIWRNKTRNGEPYKQYLSKEQKAQCYYAD